jgi:formate dehydrogenase gamma subunit
LTTSTLPLEPVPLTSEQAREMRRHQIKKHDVAMVWLHWWNAAVWFLEVTTGLALITSRFFRVAPEWYLGIVQGIFGTRAQMLQFHVALGLLWIFVYLVYGIFGFRTYLSREVLHKEIALDRDDLRWLIVRTLRILGFSNEPLPPQGIYNAGQKLFGLMVYAMIPLVMLTGLVMTFHLGGTVLVGWAVVLHFAAVGIVVSGLMIHVYMAAVFPEEKPAFFSMITGTVNELYAYSHHFKWWREAKLEEAESDRHRDGAAASKEAATPPPGGPTA